MLLLFEERILSIKNKRKIKRNFLRLIFAMIQIFHEMIIVCARKMYTELLFTLLALFETPGDLSEGVNSLVSGEDLVAKGERASLLAAQMMMGQNDIGSLGMYTV